MNGGIKGKKGKKKEIFTVLGGQKYGGGGQKYNT